MTFSDPRAKAPRDPVLAREAFKTGMACLAAGNNHDAISQLELATSLAPEEAEYHHHLGNALARNGDSEPALSALRRAVDLSPQVPFLAELAAAHLRVNEPAAAAAILADCITREPTNARHKYFFAKACLASGPQHDRTAGVRALREALALSPNTAQFGIELISALGSTDLTEAVVVADTLQPILTTATQFRELADALWAAGAVEQAFRVANSGRLRWPDSGDLVLAVAEWLRHFGRVDEATQTLLTFTDHHTAPPDVWHFLGHLLFSRGEYVAARDAYARATAERPELRAFALHQAMSAIPAGCPSEAFRLLEKFAPEARQVVHEGEFCDKIGPPGQITVNLLKGQSVRFCFNRSIMRAAAPDVRNVVTRFFESYQFFLGLCMEMTRRSAHFAFGMNDCGADEPGTAAFCSNRSDVLLLPDHVFLRTNAYAGYRRTVELNWIDWTDRVPAAYWRGSTTGSWEAGSHVTNGSLDLGRLPRLRLCQLSRTRPDLLDARVTVLVQIENPQIREAIVAAGLNAPFADSTTMIKYRFLIDIDGNSNSWSGFFERLLAGSTVIKVGSPAGYRQWFYDRLQPWVHYAPVRPDMSDLHSTLELLIKDEALARSIAENGRALALSMSVSSEQRVVASRLDQWSFG